jgi:Gas vesicle synthesis protein GvpL/GvpF
LIYVYCICGPTVAGAPHGRGLGGARLRAVQAGPVAAIYSRHRSLSIRPAVDQVLSHERVIESVMPKGAVLPLRFGTRFECEQQLVDALVRRGEELAGALERVRGHVELGLRVLPKRATASAASSGAGTGRDVLLTRVAQHGRARQARSRLHGPLAEIAAASTVREFPRPPALLVGSYLVSEGQVEAFRRRAAQLSAGCDDVRILVTGPWPPYSFAEGHR